MVVAAATGEMLYPIIVGNVRIFFVITCISIALQLFIFRPESFPIAGNLTQYAMCGVFVLLLLFGARAMGNNGLMCCVEC